MLYRGRLVSQRNIRDGFMSKKKLGSVAKKAKNIAVSTQEYVRVLADIKKRVEKAQIKATLSANKELIKLYWVMGKIIAEKQNEAGWGSGVIERLAADLQAVFPGIGGFSRTNIFNICAFYKAYTIVQQPAGFLYKLPIFQIPWWHNVVLLTRLKDNKQRLWYAEKAIE